MKNELQNLLDKIQAEDELKQKTMEVLYLEMGKRSKKTRVPRRRLAATFASLLLFLCIGGVSYHQYFTPSAYVDMDINPSIELTLNKFGRVIEANPYNDDGKVVLQDADIQNKPYQQAVQTLLDSIIKDNYLKKDGLVSVTVQTKNAQSEKDLIDRLKSTVSATLEEHHATAKSDIFAVTKQVKEHAEGYHLSPAKYIAISELQAVDPTATFESCSDHSINEIHELTRQHQNGKHSNIDEHEASPQSIGKDDFAKRNHGEKCEEETEHQDCD